MKNQVKDKQALFILFSCSCHHNPRPLHQKQTDIEQNWAASEVTFISALLTSAELDCCLVIYKAREEFPSRFIPNFQFSVIEVASISDRSRACSLK